MASADLAAWVFGVPLAAFSLYVISLNFACVYLGFVRGEHHSLSPLVGGVSGFLALLILPVAGLRPWSWLPLVVDPGCLFTALSAAYALFTERDRS